MTNIGAEALVALAKAIATYAHRGQVDKNGHDYIDHPKAVFYRIYADDEFDYDAQVVAWLHDVAEDTAVTLEHLAAFFPYYIVAAVDAITHRVGESRDDYYARVKVDPIALRVKRKDIEHNTSAKRMEKLDEATRARLTKKYAHALEVLNA